MILQTHKVYRMENHESREGLSLQTEDDLLRLLQDVRKSIDDMAFFGTLALAYRVLYSEYRSSPR